MPELRYGDKSIERAVAMALQAKPIGQLEVYVVWLMLIEMQRTQMMTMKAMNTMQEDRRGKACNPAMQSAFCCRHLSCTHCVFIQWSSGQGSS